jgi:hypothetical protein
MNDNRLEVEIGKWQHAHLAKLDEWLMRPCVIVAIGASREVSTQRLAQSDAQRAYIFIGSQLSIAGDQGGKRLASLWRESMIRSVQGISFDALLLVGGDLQPTNGIWSASGLLAGAKGASVEFQFELTAAEVRDMWTYIRWLGSARPAFDWLGDRAVGARPVAAVQRPTMRRLKAAKSSEELMQAAMGTLQEALQSVWLTASTLRPKGFAQDLAKHAKLKGLKVRCMLGDRFAAQEIAGDQPEWEVLHCPGLAGHTLLLDAESDPAAFVGSFNWMGAPAEKVHGLGLTLMVDDPRLVQLNQFWKQIGPFCDLITGPNTGSGRYS